MQVALCALGGKWFLVRCGIITTPGELEKMWGIWRTVTSNLAMRLQ